MRLVLRSHNHCFNESIIMGEPYDDTSTNTIYIVHNDVIVCLDPDELRMLLYPTPLQRPDDNDDAWTEEHKDAILYYWNIQPVPNRIDLYKSAVRIYGLEVFVDREELMHLFEARYNTIALGIPKRDYEGNYPEDIDEQEGVDFERTGLGTRRAVPQLTGEGGLTLPPIIANVYKCYPISRTELIKNRRVKDIDFDSVIFLDKFLLRADHHEYWGEEVNVNDREIKEAIDVAERSNRPIKIAPKENSYPIIISSLAIPFLKRHMGSNEPIVLVYREGMYHIDKIIPSSLPTSTMPIPPTFSVTNQYDVRQDMTDVEFKNWMIENEGMRGMDEIVRGDVRHVETRAGRMYGVNKTPYISSSVRPASLLTSVPSDPLSIVSSFLDPQSQRALRSAIPQRRGEIVGEHRLIPYISKHEQVDQVSLIDFEENRYDLQRWIETSKKFPYDEIEFLLEKNWKLDFEGVLIVWKNIKLYVVLVKLFLIGRIKNCRFVYFRKPYDNIIHSNMRDVVMYQITSCINLLIPQMFERAEFLFWLVRNTDRLIAQPSEYTSDVSSATIEEGVIEMTEYLLKIGERMNLQLQTIPYQYLPLFLHYRYESPSVTNTLEQLNRIEENLFSSLPYSQQQYERWAQDDVQTRCYRMFILQCENMFNKMESVYAYLTETQQLSFYDFIRDEADVNINLGSAKNLDLAWLDMFKLLRKRTLFVESFIRKYYYRIEQYKASPMYKLNATEKQRNRFFSFLKNLLVTTQEGNSRGASAEAPLEYILATLRSFSDKAFDDEAKRISQMNLWEAIHSDQRYGNSISIKDIQALSKRQQNEISERGLYNLRQSIIHSTDQRLMFAPFKHFEYLSIFDRYEYQSFFTAYDGEYIGLTDGLQIRSVSTPIESFLDGQDRLILIEIFDEIIRNNSNEEVVTRAQAMRQEISSGDGKIENMDEIWRFINDVRQRELVSRERQAEGKRVEEKQEPAMSVSRSPTRKKILRSLMIRDDEDVSRSAAARSYGHDENEDILGSARTTSRQSDDENILVSASINRDQLNALERRVRDAWRRIEPSQNGEFRRQGISQQRHPRLYTIGVNLTIDITLNSDFPISIQDLSREVERYERSVEQELTGHRLTNAEIRENEERRTRLQLRLQYIRNLIHNNDIISSSKYFFLLRAVENGLEDENIINEFENRVMEQFRERGGNEQVRLLVERMERIKQIINKYVERNINISVMRLEIDLRRAVFDLQANVEDLENRLIRHYDVEEFIEADRNIMELNPERRVINPRLAVLIQTINNLINNIIANMIPLNNNLADEADRLILDLSINSVNPNANEELLEARVVAFQDRINVNLIQLRTRVRRILDGYNFQITGPLFIEGTNLLQDVENNVFNPNADEQALVARVDAFEIVVNETMQRTQIERRQREEIEFVNRRKTDIETRMLRALERPNINRNRELVVQGLTLLRRVRRIQSRLELTELAPIIERFERDVANLRQ